MTPLFKLRNWALREAEKLLQGNARQGSVIASSFSGKDRWVKVDGAIAFQQQKDATGNFLAPFEHLPVPH